MLRLFPLFWLPAQLPGMNPAAAETAAPASDKIFEGYRLFGVKLIGVNAENGQKLLASVVLILVVLAVGFLLRWIGQRLVPDLRYPRASFWIRQTVRLLTTFILILGLLSIWFDDPTRLTTALGLVTAGLAFALQKVVTSIAGYFVILRGKVFHVGDRIVMGGVRGDVVSLGMTQTTILEMGQPPAVQAASPEIWVKSRQYTGRVVSVPNAKVFEEPIYNYTANVPFIWEEMTLPISYTSDRNRAEAILLEAARTHATKSAELSVQDIDALRRQHLDEPALDPAVFWRLTDNWLELTVRFVTPERGVRDIKDGMSRQILTALDAANIGIASATFEVVGIPSLRIERS